METGQGQDIISLPSEALPGEATLLCVAVLDVEMPTILVDLCLWGHSHKRERL